jgi:hypothetical protein
MVPIPDIFRLKKLVGSKRFQVSSITALALLVSAVAYFTFYISSQDNYFNNRNFRQLNSLSDQVSVRVHDLKNGVTSSAQNTLKSNKKLSFAEALKSIEGVEFTGVSQNGELTDLMSPDQVSCFVDLPPNISPVVLQVTCEPDQEIKLPEAAPKGPAFRANVNFANLIRPFLAPDVPGHQRAEHEEGFDDVLIAKAADTQSAVSAGQVIFAQSTPELMLTSLSDLRRSESVENKVDFNSFSQTTNSADIRIGGNDYRLYGQPLEMDSQQSGTHWVICGLVSVSHFRHQTWAISYTILVVLGFLGALVPLSWPFLKILFIGPKDRLRLSDVYFVCFSLFLTAALMTLFLLWSYSYMRQQSEQDGQLATLSKTIKDKIQSEIRSVLFTINRFDELHKQADNPIEGDSRLERDKRHAESAKNSSDGKANHEPYDIVQVPNVIDRLCAGDSESAKEKCLTDQDQNYLYFTSVFWTDDDGNQTTKWLRDATTTYAHNVKDRPYFTEIQNGHALTIDRQEYWLTQQASRISGAKAVPISKPKTAGRSDGVIVMGTNLLAGMDAYTPTDFGYRIINERGEVQLQSAETQQWKENFFEECNNNLMLHSIVASHITDHLDVDYKGKRHSVLVTPLEYSPGWSLIVFRDKQPLRTVYLEILTVAATLLLVYALILLTVFIGFYLANTKPSQRNQWLWPTPAMLPTYYRSIAMTSLLCVLSGSVVVVQPGAGKTFLLVTGFALIGIVGLILRSRKRWQFQVVNKLVRAMKTGLSFDYRRAYIANLVLMVVLIGIIPAIAFFKIAQHQETLLYIKHNQLKLAQGLLDRQNKIDAVYSSRRIKDDPGPISDSELAKAFIKHRLESDQDVHAKSFYGTRFYYADKAQSFSDAETTNRFIKLFVSEVPFYNQISVELWGLTDNRSADNGWKWLNDSGSLVLQLPADPKAGERLLYLETDLTKVGLPPPLFSLATLALITGFMFLLALLVFLSRFIVTKVFLLDYENRLLALRSEQFAQIDHNLFVVLNNAVLNGALDDKAMVPVDLKQLNVADTLDKVQATNGTAPSGTFVFENFEHTICDGQLADNAMTAIEKVLSGTGRVVIISKLEPFAYHWTEKTNVDHPPLISMEDRWAELIGRFTKVYFRESECADDFEEVLAGVESRIDSNTSLTRSQKKRAKQSVDVIRTECGPRLALRRFGKEIVGQANFQNLRPGQVLKQIGNQAQLYYRRIWEPLTEDEKLTLLHLAEDKLLSPNDPHIDQLFLKGLIVRDPDVRLFNCSFKDFVMRNCFTDELASVESEAKVMSPWERLKLPLLLLIGGVLLFLVITQRDFFGSSLSIIGSVIAALPSVFKLLGFFQSQSAGQKVLNSAAN